MVASENFTVEENPRSGLGQRLWDFISKPANSITDRADRRQARTLSAFLFVFFLLSGVRLLVGISSGSYVEEPEPFIFVAVLSGILLVSYLLSRSKYYSWGAVVAVISTIITVILSVVVRDDHSATRVFSTMMWLISALILGSGFFSWRVTAGVSVFTLAAILTLPLFVPGMVFDAVLSAFSVVFVASFLIVLVDRFRDQLEQDRQVELNVANQQLERSREFLEERVAERTQALQLASEISRVLSQISGLNDLLQESVETIRARFDFYYVQIYLTDELSSALVLQAGTGNIGNELVRQGHRLAISAASVNGMAAVNKRAVIVSDTAQNPLFRPNTFLPRTRSEMAVPLIIGDHVVGVLDLQSEEAHTFSSENIPAFETLAGQLAVAIENAKLLTEAADAKAEVESFTRRITQEGWSSYLDAIEHPRFVGFSYDANTLMSLDTPLSEELSERNIAQVPIEVVGEAVGAIQIEADDERIWTADDLDLIQIVATQVGQQVEMLRSLSDAAQYRKEAERALQRVTHEAWLSYEEVPELAEGFAYDRLLVEPVTAVSPSPPTTPDMIRHDLAIHGESVGELAVAKSDQVDETYADTLVTAVATQLVTHMENLRLSEQTEKALADAQRRGRQLSVINAVAQATANLTTIPDFLETVQHELEQVMPVNSFTAATYNQADNNILFEYAFDEKTGRHENNLPVQLEPHHLSYKTIVEATPQIIHYTQAEVDEHTRNRPVSMMSDDATVTASLLFVPLITGKDVVGILSVQSYELNAYNQDHISLFNGVAGYVTTAIQKARLFEQTEARAEELAVINEVAQIVAQESDQHKLFRSVYDQLQRVIPVDAYFVALYDKQTDMVSYPYLYDNHRIFQTAAEPLTPESKIYEVLQTRRPILINWTEAEVEEITQSENISILGDNEEIPASLIYVPLLVGQKILGVLSVQAYKLNAYSQSHVALLDGISNHVALSLENTRLLESTQNTAKREQVLREISATINTSIDAESVLQTAAREIGRVLGAETYVYLTSEIKNEDSTESINDSTKKNTNGATASLKSSR